MEKIVLCILDGVGLRKEIHGNAVKQAKLPVFNSLFKYPNCKLEASGINVGLPKGQMGNSEVGHSNMGAGRILYQPLELINSKIDSKEFENKIMDEALDNDIIHIMGLLSDGGIHSHIDHLFKLIDICIEKNKKVYLHLFTDGRDTLTDSAMKYFDKLEEKIKDNDNISLATISGRFYAMDRDNRKERIKQASDAIFKGIGEEYKNYKECIEANYKKDIYDEFIVPAVINKEGIIKDGDSFIIFNFRPDRLREIGLEINKLPNTKLVTMMPISSEVKYNNAFELDSINNTLGSIISKNNLKQLRIAETEKYAHVTYFFDGGKELNLKNCDKILIPSPKVKTYDMKPEMSAVEITDKLLEVLDKYDLVILNYANGDMVGHTGNLKAAIKGLETIDKCLGRLVEKTKELDYTLIVTADHGNCEYMLDDDNTILTTHTTNKVPFIILKEGLSLKNGKLGDIAPTILSLMKIKVPKEMTGNNLIKEIKNNSNGTKKVVKSTEKEHLSTENKAAVNKKDIKIVEIKKEANDIKDSKEEEKTSINIRNEKEIAKIDKLIKARQKISDRRQKIFRIISIIFILCMFIFYGARFIYYYDKTHHKEKYVETKVIYKLNSLGFVENGSGLYNINNSKIFKGNINNNYLYYKGILWRIVTYNDEYIYLMSNESVTSINYNGLSSFIGNINNKLKDDNILNVNLISSKIYNVRLYAKIDSDVVAKKGDGTLNNYYVIDNSEKDSLKEASVGEYVTFSNRNWRIMDVSNNSTQLILDGLLDERAYSNKKEIINMNDKDSLLYYLNNDFYNTLEKKSVINTKYSITKYSNESLEQTKDNLLDVSIPVMGDIFINDYQDYFLLTETNNDTIYKVNYYGLLYLDFKDSKRKVRTVININNKLNILSGEGTKNRPYVVGD